MKKQKQTIAGERTQRGLGDGQTHSERETENHDQSADPQPQNLGSERGDYLFNAIEQLVLSAALELIMKLLSCSDEPQMSPEAGKPEVIGRTSGYTRRGQDNERSP
jgi:hypothetical protein